MILMMIVILYLVGATQGFCSGYLYGKEKIKLGVKK